MLYIHVSKIHDEQRHQKVDRCRHPGRDMTIKVNTI